MIQLIHDLFQTSRSLTKELNEKLEPHGLFNTQWSILLCLKNYGPMSLSEIAKYLNVEAPTVTRTVSRIEHFGWVERKQGEDKREKIVDLSSKAHEQLEEVQKAIMSFESSVMGRLDADEKEQLSHILLKLRAGR